jgi:hypothetical protein
MAENDEVVVLNDSPTEKMSAKERAEYLAQVEVAHLYPRNIRKATEDAIAIVTMNEEIAKSCGYAIPRDGKQVTGASVHLARILAQNWTNIKTASRVKEITATQIVSEGICIDLEKNIFSGVEIRRNIIGKSGRFSDDMITVNGNASNAIAYRNAVLAVIPKTVIDMVYKAAQNKIAGDLSDEQKLVAKRKEVVDYFINTYGATEADVLKLCGKGALPGIKRDEIVFLIGLTQAIKDGDISADEVLGRNASIQKTADKLQDLSKKGNETIAEKKKHQEQQNQTGQPPEQPKRQGRPPKQQDGLFNEQK